MLEKLKNLSFYQIILGILIPIIAIAAPILWDLYTHNVDLTINVKSSSSVISKDLPIQNLELLYAGKKIDALNRLLIEIENTGKSAITLQDVLSPLELSFVSSEILEAKVIKVSPENLDFVIRQNGSQKLIANFNLLNPSDKVEIDFLLLGSDARFVAKTRIKNLNQVNIQSSLTADETTSGAYKAAVILSCLLGVLLLYFGWDELLLKAPKNFKLSERLRNGNGIFYDEPDVESAVSVFKNEFKDLSERLKKEVNSLIRKTIFPVDDSTRKQLQISISNLNNVKVGEMIKDLLGGLAVIFILGVVPLLGFYKTLIKMLTT